MKLKNLEYKKERNNSFSLFFLLFKGVLIVICIK